ncbi:hypothetical protein RJ639_006160 [Escallonia herrerae]|uniref:Uncharacterized protein n=1 Tax=Escallonia herrerae TaxID=1293975 RepID=A0AA89AYI4_9ASTE|nr:hypothetical protein RJ639_006160 [Escallonia herrerae]
MTSVLSSVKTPKTVGRDEVYVAAVALRATKGPGQLLMSTAYALNLWDLQHFMVIINPSSPPHSPALVFDFQPQDPESISVALAALSGRKVPGSILTRKLTKLPKAKCWFIKSSEVDAVDATHKFNQCWETDLRIGQHDCRDYTNGLVEYLTGEKHVLERLRESVRW